MSSRPAVHFPAGTCRFPAASPCTPLNHSAWRGSNVTRPHQGFTRVHPSGLPLACDPQTDRGSLGVFSELRTPPLPATHVRAGTGHGHWPGITPSASADLLSVNPLNLCDLVSHGPGVAGAQHDGQRLPRPLRRRGQRTRPGDGAHRSSSTSGRPAPCRSARSRSWRRCRPGSEIRPRRRARRRPAPRRARGRAARALRIARSARGASVARAVTSRDTTGSEATGPASSGWERSTAISARQSPPSASAMTRSAMILPGSCTARGARHRA